MLCGDRARHARFELCARVLCSMHARIRGGEKRRWREKEREKTLAHTSACVFFPAVLFSFLRCNKNGERHARSRTDEPPERGRKRERDREREREKEAPQLADIRHIYTYRARIIYDAVYTYIFTVDLYTWLRRGVRVRTCTCTRVNATHACITRDCARVQFLALSFARASIQCRIEFAMTMLSLSLSLCAAVCLAWLWVDVYLLAIGREAEVGLWVRAELDSRSELRFK